MTRTKQFLVPSLMNLPYLAAVIILFFMIKPDVVSALGFSTVTLIYVAAAFGSLFILLKVSNKQSSNLSHIGFILFASAILLAYLTKITPEQVGVLIQTICISAGATLLLTLFASWKKSSK
jgi:hypothetical protein